MKKEGFIKVGVLRNSMKTLQFQTKRGLTNITGDIQDSLSIDTGLVNIFCQHTSASLLIMENADSTVLDDLESWMQKHVVEDATLYKHGYEGDDDMPAHIKTAITQTSISLPVQNGELQLGTWQGIFLWEHRYSTKLRSIIMTEVKE